MTTIHYLNHLDVLVQGICLTRTGLTMTYPNSGVMGIPVLAGSVRGIFYARLLLQWPQHCVRQTTPAPAGGRYRQPSPPLVFRSTLSGGPTCRRRAFHRYWASPRILVICSSSPPWKTAITSRQCQQLAQCISLLLNSCCRQADGYGRALPIRAGGLYRLFTPVQDFWCSSRATKVPWSEG